MVRAKGKARNGSTHIRIDPETKAILDSLKVIPEQPYDSVIRDLVARVPKKNGA